MDPNESPTTTNYKQVTVDVPEDRVAEFHAFFGRFLAGRRGPGRRGGYGRQHRGAHKRRCSEGSEATERGSSTEQAAGTAEV
jgi:hypothetical protein